MTDIVERLRVYATDDHERGCDGRYYACSCGYDDKRDPLLAEAADEIARLREWNREIALNARDFAAENERLRIENIQMQAALGYAIMAEDERHILPTNPYKCGTCDASSYLRAENQRLRAALREIADFHTWEDITNEECMRDIARAALDGQPAPGKEEA